MVELGYLPPPEPDGPGIFGLAGPDRIREPVTGAGFGDPTVSQVSVEWSYDTPEDHREKDERERVKQTVAERIRGAIAGDGLGGLGGLVHVVVAS